jgi:hypothetical protein
MEEAMTYNNEPVIVLETGSVTSRIIRNGQDEWDAVWVKNTHLKVDKVAPPPPRGERVPITLNPERVEKMVRSIGGVEPENIPEDVLLKLYAVRDVVRIRFSWPPAADEAVKERFNQLGILLPEGARPMDSGVRGGAPMYSLSSEIHYPKGLGLPLGYGMEDAKGEMYVSRVSLALALAQKGFDINVATL